MMKALTIVWLVTASCSVFTANGICPSNSGVIYLMHGGYCLSEYTVISDIALTADNPLHCVLAGSSGTGGGGGQWTGPDNTAVQCGESGSDPFTCSQSSDPTNITLYKKTGASFAGKQLYTCTISGQSISVQIESNRVLLAIYIEPPADVRSVPQNYTIHCITTGHKTSSTSVRLFLETHGNTYYDQPQFSPPVSGYNQHPPPPSTLNSATHTYDYSEEVVWRADRVVVDSTEFSGQGLTKYNGDHDWACGVGIVVSGGGGYDDLQTYIRAPNFTPTNLTVLHKNATSITISWTAVDATDADGYVVYYNTTTGPDDSAVDVGDVTQYTLGRLQVFDTYNISIRAYQDLLGPATMPLIVTIQAPSGPPQSIQVDIVSDTHISVTWYPPAGGADKYIIRCTNGFVEEITVNSVTNVDQQQKTTLQGLTQGTTYTFVLFAVKDLPSVASNPVSLLFDVPLEVMSLTATFDNNHTSSISVTWDHPGGYSRVSMYHVWYIPLCSDGKNATHLNTENTNIILTDINNSSHYLIIVQAGNVLGLGQQVNTTVSGIVSTPPNRVPDGVMVTMISSNTIFISWNDLPCGLHHGLFMEVIIVIADVKGGGQIEHRVPGNWFSAVLTGLNPVTTYTIAVALSNSNGTGPYSALISVTMLAPISGAWDITILVYSTAASFLTLSVAVILLLTLVCAIKWRQSTKAKMAGTVGTPVSHRASNSYEIFELTTVVYEGACNPAAANKNL